MEKLNNDKVYLVITPFFPEPDDWHGPYVLDQVKALMRVSDYNVVVMRPCAAWQKPKDYEVDGVKVYRFKDYTIPSNLMPNRISDWLSALSLFSKLKRIGIDVKNVAVCHAHVAGLGHYALSVKKKNPDCLAVVQHHGFDVFSVTDGRLSSKKWHERLCISYGTRICNSVDLNIGVSRKTLDYVKQYPGVRLKNEYVLYNGVDTTKFYPAKEKQNNDFFTIGCIANFWPLKDQMTLITAAERLINDGQPVSVRFIGTGETRQGCERYVAEHNLQKFISFENEVMHNELPAFYQSLDLFVLPSYWEAFGCVYTESYACGVPFIGVKGQGISEIIPVEDQDKWLIDKGDDARLSGLIKSYMVSRPTQKLCAPYKITALVEQFINRIGG